MTYKEQYDYVYGFYSNQIGSEKRKYLNDMWEHLENDGGSGTTASGMQKNWFTGLYGSIPKTLMSKAHEFTKDYQSKINALPEEPASA